MFPVQAKHLACSEFKAIRLAVSLKTLGVQNWALPQDLSPPSFEGRNNEELKVNHESSLYLSGVQSFAEVCFSRLKPFVFLPLLQPFKCNINQ